MANTSGNEHEVIEGLLDEQRTFRPPDAFRANAIIQDDSVYREAEADFEGFWARLADEFLDWYTPPTERMSWDPPHCTWFADGELNVSVNCLDRHVAAGLGERVAFHWVGEPATDSRAVTYAELLAQTCHIANGLRSLGVRKGDRVGLYMGMVPELTAAMLACARIGAPHVVIFGGFSAESLGDRLDSAGAKVLVTQDEGWRKGGKVPLKLNADEAADRAPSVEHVRRSTTHRRSGAVGRGPRRLAS